MFVPLYESLRVGGSREEIWGLNLSTAPACGRAGALYLHETEGTYPSMSSFVYGWWRIDENGIRAMTTSPYPEGNYTNVEYIEKPKAKFSHCETEVVFGLSLGPEWYVKMHALIQDGCLTGMKRIYPPV